MNLEYIGFAVGVIGVILSIVGIYLTVKSVRNKEPVYSIKSNNVISDYASTYRNLTVSYKGEKVENFTVSKVLFFNRGAVTLYRDDISTLNHLRIEATYSNILDATVLQVNNPSSDFKVSLDRVNELIQIDFDYLNQHQGAVIEVVHTGLSSQDIAVLGDMKDVKSLIRLSPRSMRITEPFPFSLRRVIGTMALYVIGMMSVIGMTLTSVDTFRKWSSSPPSLVGICPLGLAIVSVPVIILVLGALIVRPFTAQNATIPKGLEKFDE